MPSPEVRMKMHIIDTVREYLDIINGVKRKCNKMYITDVLMNFLTCNQGVLDFHIKNEKFYTVTLSKIEEFLNEDEEWFVENLKTYKQKLINLKKK